MKNEIKYSKLEIKEEEKEDIMAIDKTRLVEMPVGFKRQYLSDKKDYKYIERRGGGTFYNNALYLPSMYDWVLGRDEEGVLCLVPLKKQE